MYHQVAALHGIGNILTDDEVDHRYACNHTFMPFQMAENYASCTQCGQVMWMVIEMAYCNWQGRPMEGTG